MSVVYMGSHGTVTEFDKSKESWSSYIERLEFYFDANDVFDDTKRRAILLTNIGAETSKLVTNLLMPKSPREETYKVIIKVVEKHLEPTPSVALQRYKINRTIRKPSESIFHI